MSLRRLPLLLLALLAALALASCGGSSSSTNDSSPARVAPPSTIFYGEAQIRPDGDLKEDIEAIGRKVSGGKDIGAEIEKGLQKGLAQGDSKLDYRKDVKPWLGKRAALFVGGVRSRNDADVLFILATKDADKAKEALLKGLEKNRRKRREYRGETYYQETGDQAVAGVVRGWMLVGTLPGFKAAVDTLESGKSLSDEAKFDRARDKVAKDGLASFYIDGPKALDAFALAGGSQASVAIGQLRGLPQFKNLKPSAAAVTVAEDAVRFEAPTRETPGAAEAVAKLPDDAWLGASSPQFGQQLRAQLTATSGIDQLKSILRQQSGIDLDRDLLDWVGGVSLYAGGTNPLGVNAAAVIDSKDPAASARAVKKLGALAERQGETIRRAPGGFTVTPQGAPAPVTVAVRGRKVVFAYGRDGVERALEPKGDLASSQVYKDATAALGGGRPTFLLSVPAVLELIQNAGQASDPEFQKALPYLKAFTSIAGGVDDEGGTTLGRAAVGVK